MLVNAEERNKQFTGVKAVITGKPGIGKTTLLTHLDPRHTLFIDLEAGDLAVGDFKGNEWTADAITYSIDRSLSLLKTDYIDIIQLHSFNVPFPPPNGVMDALLKAKEMGKTRFIGYSQENEAAIKAVSSKVFDNALIVPSNCSVFGQ